jgi:hypothetical protein
VTHGKATFKMADIEKAIDQVVPANIYFVKMNVDVEE